MLDLHKYTQKLYSLATAKSRGFCGRAVRSLIGHVEPRLWACASARDMYEVIASSPYFKRVENPGVGTISCIPDNGKNPYGHISICTAKGWVSDFRQKSSNPYVAKPREYLFDLSDLGKEKLKQVSLSKVTYKT